MNWVDVVWVTSAAACLTLAAIHLRIWTRDRDARAHLALSLLALAAREAEGFAAFAAGDEELVIEKMEEAARIEDGIVALSQASYPALPAREIHGNMLMEMNRPAEAMVQYAKTLERTPNRPKAIYGIARAAEAMGDMQTATERYTEFLELWKNADEDRPETAHARQFLSM